MPRSYFQIVLPAGISKLRKGSTLRSPHLNNVRRYNFAGNCCDLDQALKLAQCFFRITLPSVFRSLQSKASDVPLRACRKEPPCRGCQAPQASDARHLASSFFAYFLEVRNTSALGVSNFRFLLARGCSPSHLLRRNECRERLLRRHE